MGRLGNETPHRKWLRISEKEVARARWFNRYGQPALLLAWLPVVGDPLCLAAGLVRPIGVVPRAGDRRQFGR